MKISELIAHLEKLKEEHGDRNVFVAFAIPRCSHAEFIVDSNLAVGFQMNVCVNENWELEEGGAVCIW